MNIEFKHVVPAPLAGTFVSHPVWDNIKSFGPGRRYLIKAFSGKGKSTLLHLVHGNRQDYTGDLLLGGANTRELSPDQWAMLRQTKLSMVFQELRLFGQLTAWENIEVKGRLWNDFNEKSFREKAERLGIGPLLDRPCRLLSYGQQQRVAILRAFAQPFSWLLLDEPFSHLDTENIRIVCELVAEECAVRDAGLLLTTLGETHALTFDEIIEI